MRIINPSFTIEQLPQLNVLAFIEKIGRVCYKSESNIAPGTAESFYARILKSGHESVIEHASATVRIICNRGVTHELVRHRLCSFSQESTRYCNYAAERFGRTLTFIRPPQCADTMIGEHTILWHNLVGIRKEGQINPELPPADNVFFWNQAIAERDYMNLLDCGWSPQEARAVLPNSLKTEIVMTANIRQWRHVFKLRCASAAHPEMRQIMIPVLCGFVSVMPLVFDDILVNISNLVENGS